MKIIIVGQMVASKQGLEPLAALLRTRGHEVQAFLPGGKDFSPEDRKLLIDFAGREKPDALIVGMASQLELAVEEVAIGAWAKEKRVPVFFYADTFGSWNKAWFADFLPGETLFVVNDNEAVQAREKFPETTVFATGNPAWDDFFFGEHKGRAEVREILGISGDDFVIMVPWGKSAPVNILHLNAVIEASAQQTFGALRILVATHPGDKTSADVYEDLVKFSPVPVSIVPKDTLSASQMLGGVNLVVGSASTVGVEAVCRRIPSIDFFSRLALKRLERSIGTSRWEPCEQGVSMWSLSARHLADAIGGVPMGAPWVSMQRTAQEHFYYRPTVQGEVLREMAEAIEEKLS